MATVDYGIIVRSDGERVWIKPRCPHCGYLEQSDWNLQIFYVPTSPYSKKTGGYTCKNCRKGFTITVYPG